MKRRIEPDVGGRKSGVSEELRQKKFEPPASLDQARHEFDKKHFSPGDLPGEKFVMASGQKELCPTEFISFASRYASLRKAEGKSSDCNVCSSKKLNRPCLCLPWSSEAGG